MVCSICGAIAWCIGILGQRAHFRCEGCGCEFSVAVNEIPELEIDVTLEKDED